jgi:hypothetical protein
MATKGMPDLVLCAVFIFPIKFITVHLVFLDLFMAYPKTKLEINGDKASPCFIPFWIGKLSENYLHIWTSLTNFMGIPNSMRILYNTSLLTES